MARKPRQRPKDTSDSDPEAQRRGAEATGKTEIRVRMFRQGLGDCFLVSILRAGGARFHLMIDCGLILGTTDIESRLRTVITDIVEATDGYVDVLAVTHEHYDHVAGFVLAPDLFAGPGDHAGNIGKIRFGEVWFAWTEDPGDAEAAKLREERAEHVSALAGMAKHLAGITSRGAGLKAASEAGETLTGTLAFFGIEEADFGAANAMSSGKTDNANAGDKKVGRTAQAMINAQGFVPKDKVAYLTPGRVIELPDAAEIRIYVLGPPVDRAHLMKTDSRAEVYALQVEGLAASMATTIGRDRDGSNLDPSAPFDPAWSYSLETFGGDERRKKSPSMPEFNDDPLADFFATHYFGSETPSPETDVEWRRIDGAWTANAELLALALDGATNNTSLVLAIEVKSSGKVLLFPGDAQVGNWLSWQSVPFEGTDKTANQLLEKTIFYKVGHHGSHNATMKAKGLERMPPEGLAAFVPVDHKMACKKRWTKMPLDEIMAQLAKRAANGGVVARIDKGAAAAHPAISDGPPGTPPWPEWPRWIDWTIAI